MKGKAVSVKHIILYLLFLCSLGWQATFASEKSAYSFPTEIPVENEKRLTLYQAITSDSTVQQQKIAYLARLAYLTSQDETTASDVEELEKKMETLRKQLPDDEELAAALGSTISYKSSFFTNELAKLSLFSRQGNRLMDRAVKKQPENLGARLQRGIASANMPHFVKRAHYAVQDLELVRDQIGLQFGADFKAFVEFYLAQAYSRNRQVMDAKALWNEVAKSNTRWAVKSKLALKEF